MEKPNLKMPCALELENPKEKKWLFAVWILPYWFYGRVKKLQEELITLSKQNAFVMISKSGGAE
jgi:hypothetical protein